MHRIVSALVVAGTLGIASSAVAAELPLKAPVYAPVPVYTWTGCYLGVNVGGTWGHKDNIDLSPPQPVALPLGSHDVRGPVAGGQVGCDYQVGGLVFGAQGMFDWADLSGGNTDPSDPTGDLAFRTEARWFAALTGRIGYAVMPNLLIYGRGGVAWVHETYTAYFLSTGATDFTETVTRNGWLAGGGLEYLFAPNWSFFLEYDYIGLGARNTSADWLREDMNLQTFLFGLSYHFNWGGPVVARY